MKNKKANLLTENIVFIILNLVFLVILSVFLISKMGGAAVLEERYAKQIAMIIDSARSGMEIRINMEEAFNEADKNKWDRNNVVSIKENIVNVKLREKGSGYSYSFFNDVDVNGYYDSVNKKDYLIKELKYR